MQQLRRWFFFAAIVLVGCYAGGVLIHLRNSWDIGIRCLFSDRDLGQPGAVGPLVRWVDAEGVGPGAPEPGDRLIGVAGAAVPTMMHLQQRLAEIHPAEAATTPPPLAPPVELGRLPADVSQADVDGYRWVRADFIRPTDEPELVRHAWLRLEPTSRAAVLASLAWLLLEMVILGIGALVVWRRPGDTSAAIFFALCAVNVVTFMAGFHWTTLIGSRPLVYPFVLGALLMAPMTLHFYALFPRPLPSIRQYPRLAPILLYAVPAVWIVVTFSYLLRAHWLLESGSPVDLAQSLHALGVFFQNYLWVSGLYFLAGFAVLRHKFVHSRTRAERDQVKWLVGAALLATVPLVYLLATAIEDRAEFAFGTLPKVSLYAVSLTFTLAYAISITRYKLMQVGELLNRGIVYVGISFAATVLFCVMVGLATALVGTYYFRWENAVMAGMTAMVVVVSLGWVRDRLQRVINRRFYREKYQLDKAVRRLSEAVEQLVEPSQLARQLIQSLGDSIGSERAAVYLRDQESQFELVYSTLWPGLPERLAADDPLVRGLVGRGVTVDGRPLRELGGKLACVLESEGTALGLILLGPKEDGSAYSVEDQNFLLALARIAALALRGAQGFRTIDSLKEELQEKVQKLAEQQRRIMFLQSQLLKGNQANAGELPAGNDAAEPLKHDVRGSSPAIRELLDQVAKVARSPSSVLIRGESGTGKELIARAIHVNSPRSGGPFVQVHCAALSVGLLESELFGHVKGAFTGADRDKAGRFELADGGSLFLDEIGDISLETQTKLLRVLQERSFERVGGVQTLQVDVRLIAATHQNLEELIRRGRFREDLFYRLNVISLRCPSLRDRREDLFELSLHFLHVYAERARKNIVRIDEDALESLASYSWPGNIRQLENAIERAVVLADGETIGLDDLPPEIAAAETTTVRRTRSVNRVERFLQSSPRESASSPIAEPSGLPGQVADLEREQLVTALARSGGNKSQAARLLGIPRSTLFSKLRKHGLE